MSFSRPDRDTPQPPREDCAVVAPCGTSSIDSDVQDQQPTEIPLDSPHVSERTPLLQPPPAISGFRESATDDPHDAMPTEQIPTSKLVGEELRVLATYSLPVFGAQLLEFSFIMASVIAIGHISTLALAAATLGSMSAAITGYSIVEGLVSSLDTLLPPAWTSDIPSRVGLWTQRMALFIGMVLIPITVTWFKAEPILLALNQEPEVARLAGIYLRWTSLGLPAYSFNCISKRYFQSQGLFDVPTRIVLVVAPINAFLNWLLVYPLGLSFPGAPLATALSYNLVSLAYILYGYYYAPRAAWSPITRESLNLTSGEIWKDWGLLAKLGIAGVAQSASEWWSWELIGLAASQLGPVALAAQSVLTTSSTTTFQVPFAFGIATSVRIGNLLGERNARVARITAITSLVIAVAFGCLFSAIFLAFRDRWCSLFNDDPEVISLVGSILPVVALFQVFDGMAAVNAGIFRARGKQVAGAILNVCAYYGLGIPFGLYLAFVRGHALAGLWQGLTVALVCCAGVGLWIGVRGVDWEAEVAIARERARGKDKGKARDE